MSIAEFKGVHRWLSNFAIAPVVYEGMLFPTVEHAYQTAKTLDWDAREEIRKAYSSGKAKQMGKRVQIRGDWDEVKLHVMEILLRQKFAVEPYRSALISTGNAELIEGNWWNDHYWGVCRGVGENHLGRLIMEIRAELQ
jgi:ribA/ribD-fused uncharacterized protein